MSRRAVSRHPIAFMLLALLAAPAADAATRAWPAPGGGSPCTGLTLQACIAGATAGDSIVIGDDEAILPDGYTAIDESLVIAVPVTLTTRAGLDAVLLPGRGITVDIAGSAVNVSISNLTLRRGAIRITHRASGSSTYSLTRNRLLDAASGCLVDYRTQPGAGAAQFIVGDNVLTTDAAGDPAARPLGICVIADDVSPLRVDVFRNRVEVPGARLLRAISVVGGGLTAAYISGNVIRGDGFQAGIHVQALTPAATARVVDIRSNFVRGQRVLPSGSEYAIAVDGDDIDARIANNTVVDNARGLSVLGTVPGAIGGRVANNIVVYSTLSGMTLNGAGTSALVNSHNLVFGNAIDFWTPGPDTIVADPQFRRRGTGELAFSSPAIDSGNDGDLPVLTGFDAVGTFRRLGAAVDRGALEFSDDRTAQHVTTPSSVSFNTSLVSELGVLGSAETIVATPHHASVPDITQQPGVYLAVPPQQQWAVFNENPSVPMSVDRRFSVMAPLRGYRAFRHVSTPGNTFDEYTRLDDAELNARPFAIAIATARYESPTTNAYHDHPIGLAYFSNRWYVRNHDLAAMQFDHAFNVVVAPLGAPGAFVVTALSTSTALVLSHPYLDDNPCAAPLVARGDDTGDPLSPANPTAFSVEYPWMAAGRTGRWLVRAEGGGTFPAGASFHVIVDGAQAIGCSAVRFGGDVMFRDSFE